mmetsp:Transcript_6350/g.14572  ORF Transcript_6350/g.14572 Transcript_6350/m.14572 type:complete len:223 (-) Transcript_6350:658-1326(-)
MSSALSSLNPIMEATAEGLLATSSAVTHAAAALGIQSEMLTWCSSLLLAALLGAFLFSSFGGKAVGFKADQSGVGDTLQEISEEDYLSLGMPAEPHLEGGFLPPTRLLHSNSTEAFAFDNENCKGLFLPLHRPTYDKRLDASGKYRYGEHFTGKKRLWELRFRFQFKRPLSQADLFFRSGAGRVCGTQCRYQASYGPFGEWHASSGGRSAVPQPRRSRRGGR